VSNWITEAFLATEELKAGLSEALGARFDRVWDRLSRMNGGRSVEAALTSPAATPFLSLIEAYRRDLGLPDDERLADIGAGALALYLYVRVQDDIVDEPELFEPAYVYVAEALSSASQAAFARALPDDRGLSAYRAAVMRAFAEAAAWEIDVYRRGEGPAGGPPEREALRRSGQKFLPMAVPLGAVACASARAGDLSRLPRFVEALGTGLQLANDVLNAAEDHAAGRATPVLGWLYAGGGSAPGRPAEAARAALLGDAALKRAQAAARRAITSAEELALEMSAPGLAAEARARLGFIDSLPRRLLALCLRLEAA
jgi:hypothetical protein